MSEGYGVHTKNPHPYEKLHLSEHSTPHTKTLIVQIVHFVFL